MKKIIFTIILTLFLFSCQNNEEKQENNQVSENKIETQKQENTKEVLDDKTLEQIEKVRKIKANKNLKYIILNQSGSLEDNLLKIEKNPDTSIIINNLNEDILNKNNLEKLFSKINNYATSLYIPPENQDIFFENLKFIKTEQLSLDIKDIRLNEANWEEISKLELKELNLGFRYKFQNIKFAKILAKSKINRIHFSYNISDEVAKILRNSETIGEIVNDYRENSLHLENYDDENKITEEVSKNYNKRLVFQKYDDKMFKFFPKIKKYHIDFVIPDEEEKVQKLIDNLDKIDAKEICINFNPKEPANIQDYLDDKYWEKLANLKLDYLGINHLNNITENQAKIISKSFITEIGFYFRGFQNKKIEEILKNAKTTFIGNSKCVYY